MELATAIMANKTFRFLKGWKRYVCALACISVQPINAAFTTSWPIDIPATVGGNTALVGFTGATGLYTITQIIDWTFSTTGGTPPPPPAATPVISPATGTYTSTQTVTITDSTSNSSIFYTLDGSQPTTSSTPYTGSFTVSSTTTVHPRMAKRFT